MTEEQAKVKMGELLDRMGKINQEKLKLAKEIEEFMASQSKCPYCGKRLVNGKCTE